MHKSFKQITTTTAAIAVVTFIALGTTSALAATGNGAAGARGGDATQAYPQDNCMQSPASTTYTPCWNNG